MIYDQYKYSVFVEPITSKIIAYKIKNNVVYRVLNESALQFLKQHNIDYRFNEGHFLYFKNKKDAMLFKIAFS